MKNANPRKWFYEFLVGIKCPPPVFQNLFTGSNLSNVHLWHYSSFTINLHVCTIEQMLSFLLLNTFLCTEQYSGWRLRHSRNGKKCFANFFSCTFYVEGKICFPQFVTNSSCFSPVATATQRTGIPLAGTYFSAPFCMLEQVWASLSR